MEEYGFAMASEVRMPQRDSNPRYHVERALTSVSPIADTRGSSSFNSGC
jgi:hypothetical protein